MHKNINLEISVYNEILDIFKKYYSGTFQEFSVTELIEIDLPDTSSNIVKSNGGKLLCTVFPGLEGLFRKDRPDTFRYGRVVCDLVKDTFNCGGFFTSDELPKYGIGRSDTREIFKKAEKKVGDLVVIFLYDRTMSIKILNFLAEFFNNEVKDSSIQMSIPSSTNH